MSYKEDNKLKHLSIKRQHSYVDNVNIVIKIITGGEELFCMAILGDKKGYPQLLIRYVTFVDK